MVCDGTEKLIEQRQLDNGMEIALYDHSRVMAGDRWLVELVYMAYIPLSDAFWDTVAHEEPHILAAVKEMLGNSLVQTFSKQRNFVAADQRDSLFQEMVQQVYIGMLEYLSKPNFPMKLFRKQYRDARQKILIQQAMLRAENR